MRLFLVVAFPIALFLYGHGLEAPGYLDDGSVLETSTTPRLGGSRLVGFNSFYLTNQLADSTLASLLPFRVIFYHRLANLLLHVLVAAGVVGLGRELGLRYRAALLAGMLFLVHPLTTAPVMYVTQRFEVLVTLFMVLAAGAYVRSRRTRQWGWMGVAGVMAVLAAYSKETAVALPMWILLIEAVFYRDRWRWDRRLLLLIPMVMIIALPAWQIFRSSSERTLTQVPLADHLASGGSVLLKYLQLAVFPVDQYLRYDIQAGEPAIGGLATSWVVIVVLVGVAVWLGARGRIAGFGLLTFFILLLPMTLLPLPDLIFEYRAYPGMVGLVLAAGMLLQPRSVRISRSGLVLSAGLLLVFGPRTFQQVGAWNDDLAFYEAHRDRFPTDPYTLSDLGIRYHSRGEVETALETFEQARLYEGRFNPYYSEVGRLNIALNTTTVLLSLRDFDRAGEELARARELRPDERAVLLMEGAYQTARGEPEQAVEPYRRLTELYPDDPQGWYWLTQIHLQLGNEQAAALAAEEFTALDQTPASPARPAEMSETTRTAGTFALVFVIVALSGFSALWTVSHLRRNWPHLVGRKVEDPAPKSEPPGPTS